MVPSSARMSETPAGRPPVGPRANGRRQGVPTYVSVVPLALGGVSAGFGAKGRGVVARRLRVTRPGCMRKQTCPYVARRPGNMEVRREYRT